MDSKNLVEKIIEILDDKKAENITHIDLSTKNYMAEHAVIATAGSTRKVYALYAYVEKFFKENGILPHSEGLQQSEWILVFAHGISVHIFTPEKREFYDLEGMWK